MKKKIFVKGPVLSQSGYGEQARFALRALRSKEEMLDIFIQPIPWGQTGWIWEDTEFRQWMDERISITQQLSNQKKLTADVSLQITIPNEFEKIAPVNIGYTAGIESSHVAPIWLQKGNEAVDKILVVSNHAKQTYKGTVVKAQNAQTGAMVDYSLKTPVEVVWENTERFEPEPIDSLELPFDSNFLMISQFGPRKNFLSSIQWWIEEFIDQEVGLLVKTSIRNNSLSDFQKTARMLKDICSKYKDRKCKVFLLHGDLFAPQMTWLYQHPKIKGLINISHGEGFGLPMFEAAREGMPIITVGWSGQLDFLIHDGKEYFQSVEYTIANVNKEAVWDGVLQADSKWAYADQGSYKMTLRRALKNYDKHKKTAEELKHLINEKFSNEVLYDRFLEKMGIKMPEKTDYVFVSDFFANQLIGGAELTLDVLVQSCKGSKTELNSQSVSKASIDYNSEATWIFGNIANLNKEVLKYVIESGIKYHFIEFDYKFCEYRNPVLYEFLEDEKCDYVNTDMGSLYTDFINNSIMTHFMSEGQLQVFLDSLPNIDNSKTHVLSSLFSDSFFEKIENLNSTEKEKEKWLVLGSRSWVKGAKESETWCKNNNLDYEVVADLSHDEMLKKLSESKGICFKPTGLDTCPRFVIEAKLLGCELELNDNVQHLNEDWFSTDDTQATINYLKNRKNHFWDLVNNNG